VSTQEVTTQDQAKAAYALQQEIVQAQGVSRLALWTLAEKLYQFEQMRGWLLLGCETLSEWLADSDVTLTSGTFYRLARTWQRLAIERKIKPERLRQLEQSKVAVVTGSIVEGTVPIKEALSDAEVLGIRDLRAKYLGSPVPTGGDSGSTPSSGPATDDAGPSSGPTQADLDADAEDACWFEVEQAVDTNADYPRLKRSVLVTLLAAHKARLAT
jgi:hypothetical protein